MTVEAQIYQVLNGIVARTLTDFAPVSTQRPFCTYQQIGGRALSYLDGTLPSKENAEIQINIWADTRAEAVALIKQIEVALSASTAFQASATSARVSDFDADIPVYCSRQDWSIWCDR